MPTPFTQSEEKRFDKEFYSFANTQERYGWGAMKSEIKQFILSHDARRDDELRKNIGMMRQWLNEDRITDPKKLVTNEDIADWLFTSK